MACAGQSGGSAQLRGHVKYQIDLIDYHMYSFRFDHVRQRSMRVLGWIDELVDNLIPHAAKKIGQLTRNFLPVLLRYSQTLQILLVAYKKLAVREG
jgi:hypothetical protein